MPMRGRSLEVVVVVVDLEVAEGVGVEEEAVGATWAVEEEEGVAEEDVGVGEVVEAEEGEEVSVQRRLEALPHFRAIRLRLTRKLHSVGGEWLGGGLHPLPLGCNRGHFYMLP